MSLVAFRESSAEPAKKIKALLLFMWRSINSPEKSAKAVNDRYGSVGNVEGHAGSLNLYGSGQFSDMFLDMWQSEGFSNYVTEDNAHDDHDEVRGGVLPCLAFVLSRFSTNFLFVLL